MQLKIKELREEYGITQYELAEKIGNAQRNISNWEKGVSEPDCETILKLADIFKISLDELFGRNENYTHQADIDRSLISLIRRLNKEQIAGLKAFLLTITA